MTDTTATADATSDEARTAHDPEPWTYSPANKGARGGDHKVFAGDGVLIGRIYDVYGQNARRIVACVNACAGLPNEVLELYGPGRYELGAVLTAPISLRIERDELAAAASEARADAQALLISVNKMDGYCHEALAWIGRGDLTRAKQQLHIARDVARETARLASRYASERTA